MPTEQHVTCTDGHGSRLTLSYLSGTDIAHIACVDGDSYDVTVFALDEVSARRLTLKLASIAAHMSYARLDGR